MSKSEERLGALPFVIGGLSFIPLIGVLFGAVAILWGLLTKKLGGKTLALIGTAGIFFTVSIYGGLFYFGFVQRGGIFDRLRTQLVQRELTDLVAQIEMYKLQHGRYPASLVELRDSLPKGSAVFINDPSDRKFHGTGRLFYYERVGADHYYLRSVGPDGVPFTADDILPQIDPTSAGKLGLLLERRAAPASATDDGSRLARRHHHHMYYKIVLLARFARG